MILDDTREVTRDEVAANLELVADSLRTDGAFELEIDGESYTFNPPETMTYEIEIEDEEVEDGVEREVQFQCNYSCAQEEESLTADGV